MKLVANSVTKTTIWLPFLLLSSTVHEIREKLFPGVKAEIQIRENFFPRNSKNPKSAKFNSRENFMPLGIVFPTEAEYSYFLPIFC